MSSSRNGLVPKVKEMRPHPWRVAGIGSIAALVVILAGIAGASGATSERCPPDRDVMTFGPARAEGDPVYQELSDVVAIVAKDVGYDPLTVGDLDRIRAASAAAVTADANEVDPNLRDTDLVVDLHVTVDGSERTGYLVGGGSFCARVSSGND